MVLRRYILCKDKEKPDVERSLIMDGTASVAGVGAGTSQANIRVNHQVRALKEQLSASRDLGVAALKLIQSAIVEGTLASHVLDLSA